MNEYKLPQWVRDFFAHLERTANQINPTYAAIEAEILKRLKEESGYQMKSAYDEIERKLISCDERKRLLYVIVKSAVFIKSKRKQEIKEERKHLRDLQGNISSTVGKLIRLLDKHEKCLLGERRDYGGRPYQDPIELVIKAGLDMKPVARRSHFKTRVSPVLWRIYSEQEGINNMMIYDGEKMPKLQDVLQILKNRMKENIEKPKGASSALLRSRKSVANNGKINGADFIRLLAWEVSRCCQAGLFPDGFCLTADTIANITGSVLETTNDYYEEWAVKRVFKNM